MAMIALRVPQDVALMLEGVETPGDNHSASDMHVTILYLGDDTPIANLAMAMVAMHEVASKWSPFLMSVDGVSSFDSNDEGKTPIIAPVESPELHELHEALKESLKTHGVWFSEKYPEYKPHVTLSYADEGDANDKTFPKPVTWGAYGLDLYGGNEGMRGPFAHLPFSIPPSTEVKLSSVAHRISDRRFLRKR